MASIEKCNNDVKFTKMRFVARNSMENTHPKTIARLSQVYRSFAKEESD